MMADSVKRKSRSKERSRSRTTNQKKKSKRTSSTSSRSSTSSSNISVKRKSTACSKEKRRKSRRYSSSPSSRSSSSSNSSSLSSPRKDNPHRNTKYLKKSSCHGVDRLTERNSSERAALSRERFKHEPRTTNDNKPPTIRSRSAKKNDDEQKSSSHRLKSDSCHGEERHHRPNNKHQRSERDKRPRDYYSNLRNSGGLKPTEESADYRRSNRSSVPRSRRDGEALRNNEDRNSGSSGHWERIKDAKKREDLSSKKRAQDLGEHSLSLSKNTDKKFKKRRSASSSSSSNTSSSSSDESKAENARKKRKKAAAKKLKKAEKRQRKKEKKLKKKLKKIKPKPQEVEEEKITQVVDESSSNDRLLNDIPLEVIERAKAMAPMTKEQWEKKQSIIRRVYDEETGRHRLIKGGGEVLEEIVSRDRHREINRQATRGDGEFFQSQLRLAK